MGIDRRYRLGQVIRLTAGLAIVALASAACSGSPAGAGSAGGSGAGSGGGAESPRASGLAYAACMRSHGVPDFPDPSSGGAIVINPASGIDLNAPQFDAAQRACQKLVPRSAVSPSTMQAAAKFLRFSVCMQQHGFPSFPEPKIVGNAAELLRPPQDSPSSWDPNSPLFKSAWRRCGHFLPGGGAMGPPPDGPAAPPGSGSSV